MASVRTSEVGSEILHVVKYIKVCIVCQHNSSVECKKHEQKYSNCEASGPDRRVKSLSQINHEYKHSSVASYTRGDILR
jgi:predicted secreted protein